MSEKKRFVFFSLKFLVSKFPNSPAVFVFVWLGLIISVYLFTYKSRFMYVNSIGSGDLSHDLVR